MTGLRDSDALREAFASCDRALATAGDCPSPENIWLAVSEQLPHEQTRLVILHLSACGSCAEAWRLAHGAVSQLPREGHIGRPAAWRSAWVWGPGLAAAAVLVIGLVLDRGLEPFPPAHAPSFRQSTEGTIRSLLADDARVSRDGMVLRWTPGPEGTRYDVRVFTDDLSAVASAAGVEQPEFAVPAARLEGYPAGTRLLWQVDVVARDGSRQPSSTFRLRLN